VRDLFTIVAVLVVAVLCAALAVPYAVDWQAWRGEVETALGRAFGVPVRTEGAITVRLLPVPRLALERVAVGGGAPLLTADALNVSLEAPPLLGGRIRVSEAQLVRPVIAVRVDESGAFHLPAAPEAPLLKFGGAGIERLVVERGIVRLTGDAMTKSGPLDIGPLDFEAQATTLAGPWRVEGALGGVPVHLATGAFEADGRLRLKLRAGTGGQARAEFDGQVLLAAAPSLSGRFAATVPLPEFANGDAPEPVSLAVNATISSDGWRIEGRDVAVRAGEGTGALTLGGEGHVDAAPLLAGEAPRLRLALEGRRIDLSPLTRDAAGASASEAALEALRARFIAGGFADMPVDLSLSTGSVALSGVEAGPASLDLRVERAENGLRLGLPRVALALPGGGALEAEGAATWDDRPAFSGRVRLEGGDATRLAGALAELGAPARVAEALRQWPGFTFEGQVVASADDLMLHDFRLASERTTVAGSLRRTRPQGALRGRIETRLAVSGLDLSALPSFDPAALVQAGTDLGVAIEATGLRLGDDEAVPDRRLSAKFTAASAGISIRQFEISDAGGAAFAASGHLDDDGGRVVASLKAREPEGLLEIARGFVPQAWGGVLSRAAAFARPLALEATIARPGAGRPLVAVVRGRAGAADIDAHVTSDPAGEANDRAVIAATLTTQDARALLAQAGLTAGDAGAKSPKERAVLTLSARGNTFERLHGEAALELAESRARLAGTWQSAQGRATLAGRLTLESPDAGALAALAGHSVPALTGRSPVTVAGNAVWNADELRLENLQGQIAGENVAGALALAGDEVSGQLTLDRLSLTDLLALSFGPQVRPARGRLWSSERFVAAGPGLAGKLRLRAGALAVSPTLTLADVSLLLDLAPDTVGLQKVAGTLPGGGAARADILLRRFGSLASFRAGIEIEGADIAHLTGEALAGRLTGRIEVGAAAESPAGLVVNLAGGGEFRVADTALPRLDPAALARLMPEWLGAGDAAIDIDIARMTDRLGAELDRAAWPVKALTIPLTVAGGAVRFGPLALESAQARAGINGTFDLATLTLDARASLAATAAPRGWTGSPPQAGVSWRGPPGALKRDIDAGSTANALAAIGLTRELDRIERMEAEARERVERARQARQEREQQARERQERERQEQQERERLERILRESAPAATDDAQTRPATPFDMTPDAAAP
jgi:hypothetical protein